MEKPLLNNPLVYPTDEELKKVLGSAFEALSELMLRIADMELVPEWRFYKDGGAWLCKVQFKKKTVFWLSVWESHFKVVFYFTEKTVEGLMPLPIESNLFQQLKLVNRIGKFIPLIFRIQMSSQLDDVFTVADYKKKLK